MIPETSSTGSQEPEIKPLVSDETRKKIFKRVFLAHVIFIFIPFLWITVEGWFTPNPPDVMVIDLPAMPKTFSDNINIPSGSQQSGDPGIPTPPEPTPPTPTPPAKEVAEPVDEPTVIAPKPLPPEPKVISLQKKVKERIQKKQKEAQDKKLAQEKEKEKKFKAATPQDIKDMNNKRIGQPGSGGFGKGQGTGQGQPGPIGYGGRGTGELTAPYEQGLGFYLKQYWDTPEKRLLNGKLPEVTVQINIAADGRIISHRILKLSGNQLMDDSVERLFMSVKQVPAPPDRVPREVALIMAIGEDDK
jgi:TonB family protein